MLNVMSLEKLYGIRIQKKRFNDFLEVIEFLKTEISQNRPCIIHMDSFELPWSNLIRDCKNFVSLEKEHCYRIAIKTEKENQQIAKLFLNLNQKLQLMTGL